jgi:hypothetical protein
VKPHYCKSHSISYREAAERMRLSTERLVEGRAGLRAYRVASAVWTLTAGYSKAWDTVFIDGLADLTGMDERSVRRGLKECVKVGALQWRPTRWKHGTPSLVGLPSATEDADTGSNRPGEEAVTGPVTGRDTGSNRPDYLEPRTGTPFGASHPLEGEATHPGEQRCSRCGGSLGYLIDGDGPSDGALCLRCFQGR